MSHPTKLHISLFTGDLLPAAGELLAERCRDDRSIMPVLPARFEDPLIAQAAVLACLEREHASGVATLDGDRLLGFMIGDLVIDEVWGRSAWVRQAGCALATGQNPELVRDLYAALAATWVEAGCFTHFAMMPATNPALLHAWHALSFGIEQVYGLRSLKASNTELPNVTPDVEVRRAASADREALASMYDLIWRANVASPVWGVHLPENDGELREAYSELVDDPTATIWLAFLDGEPVGFQCYFPGEPAADALLVPQACTVLEVAGTRPHARGKGIGSLLTKYGLAHAYASGSRYCLADWRSANLLASRFWPSQGFQPAAYRLSRRVDPRISWGR